MESNEKIPKRAFHIAAKARNVTSELASLSTIRKNKALTTLTHLLEKHQDNLIKANKKDLDNAEKNGLPREHINRLIFDRSKIKSRITSLKKIIRLPDPVGQMEKMGVMDNGITYGRMRIPLGVILMIYEARPHVTINAGSFALKSGNAIILKGGSEAKHCLDILSKLWKESLEENEISADAVQVVTLSHEEIAGLLSRNDLIDLVIPRGGKSLIETVCEQSEIPVIKHYEGNCHVYIGKNADWEKAVTIMLDSKLLMPGVCNAAESLLIDKSRKEWVPNIVEILNKNKIEVRGCSETLKLTSKAVPARQEDYATEYLDKIYSMKIVKDVFEAVKHINTFGSGHTEAIVTNRYADAQYFLSAVDSSVVLVNSSTMYCDGESLGMGAEIGISTDKLHARGPMGLNELTSYKFILRGNGQIMGDASQWKTL